MYILPYPVDLTSWPATTMAVDSQDETKGRCGSGLDVNVKKRKRTLDLEDPTQKTDPHGTISSNYLFHTSLPTPTPSTSSFLSDTFHLHLPMTPVSAMKRANSTFPPGKRVQLSPSLRARPLPLRSRTENDITAHSPILHRCHICHRKPITMQDVPAYADCESCQQRTCYICMRTCAGPRCHLPARPDSHKPSTPNTLASTAGTQACSKCCVEVGVDGRVWCLVCYDDDADAEDDAHGPRKQDLRSAQVDRVADWLEGCGAEEDDDR